MYLGEPHYVVAGITACCTSGTSPSSQPTLNRREGHLTWEWAVGLRSYAHPVLFALPYALLKALRADVAWAVIAMPQLVQGCLAALADWFVFRTAQLLFGGGAAR